MKNIILFILINFICLGYANSQIREKGSAINIEGINEAAVKVTNSGDAAESLNKQPVKKNVPATLFENGVWIDEKNQQPTKETTKEKTEVKNTAVKKIVPVILFDKGVWVADKNPKPNQKSAQTTAVNSEGILAGNTTGDENIDCYIVDSATRYDIDPLLIYAQIYQESGFKLRATSYKGARGLMQLMPATAARFGVKNIYDPKQNIDGGIKYMRWLLDKFGGDEILALAGYNAGEGAVIKHGNQIPPYQETRQYVKKIIAHYNSIKNRARARM